MAVERRPGTGALLALGLATGCLAPTLPPWDVDGDGYGHAEDCDPDDPAVHAHAPEICDDGVDNDCDGEVDAWDPQCHRTSTSDGWSRVASGGMATCGILDDEIVCWGLQSLASTPEGTFQDVDLGSMHACALSTSGHLKAWASNWICVMTGVCDPPEGMFSRVFGGKSSCCALDAHGIASCWGLFAEDPPEGSFVNLAAWGHICGLSEAGEVTCWGCTWDMDNNCAPPPGVPFVVITVGADFSCGVTEDGALACWGEVPFDVDEAASETFTEVSAGGYRVCGLRTDGSLVCYGGDEDLVEEFGPAQAPDGTFQQVSVGEDHSCALTDDGRIRCWGPNAFGQVNPP